MIHQTHAKAIHSYCNRNETMIVIWIFQKMVENVGTEESSLVHSQVESHIGKKQKKRSQIH